MTHQDIVDTAFRVWGQEAYTKMSLKDLTEALGVTKPALYRHFPDKQALLDSMYTVFFDRYAELLQNTIERIPMDGDMEIRVSMIVSTISEYYLRNTYDFIFYFLRVLGSKRKPLDELKRRGVAIEEILRIDRDLGVPGMFMVISLTILLFVALFHIKNCKEEYPYPEEAIARVVKEITHRIFYGFEFGIEEIEKIDYEALEAMTASIKQVDQGESDLLKAVASVVAELGPWNASMEQVAKCSGLSKSGLYAHFKNKQDMLRQLFNREFEGITEKLEQLGAFSVTKGERLFLLMNTLSQYLHHRSSILELLDWIRIRQLDLRITILSRLISCFSFLTPSSDREDTGISPLSQVNTGKWIFFLVVSVLMADIRHVPTLGIRDLFQYTASGLKGWSI